MTKDSIRNLANQLTTDEAFELLNALSVRDDLLIPLFYSMHDISYYASEDYLDLDLEITPYVMESIKDHMSGLDPLYEAADNAISETLYDIVENDKGEMRDQKLNKILCQTGVKTI